MVASEVEMEREVRGCLVEVEGEELVRVDDAERAREVGEKDVDP